MVTKFEAADGTIFFDEDVCMEYERKLKHEIEAKMLSLVVSDEMDLKVLFGFKESGEPTIVLIQLKRLTDIETILTYYKLEYPKYYCCQQNIDELKKKLLTAFYEGDFCVFYKKEYNNECPTDFEYMNNLKDIIHKFELLVKSVQR